MRQMRWLLGLFCLLPMAASSQSPAKPGWKQVCAHATAQPLPAQAPAGPLPAAELNGCDETALYYGNPGQPDYGAALQCGWYQRAHPQPSVGNMFYGPGVLAMLYANGQGVTRDLNLAIRFACENTWAADAEMEGRIGHLEQMQSSPSAAKSFDLCDDGTSGLTMGTCASVDARRLDTVRDGKILAVTASLPVAARTAFATLQHAEADFEDQRAGKEIDLSGTARGMFVLHEEGILRDQFLINLQRFGRSDIPQATVADLAALDKSLNATYQAALGTRPTGGSTITPDGVRETERAWLRLAEAWQAFARVAYPTLSSTRLRAQLIRLRLHQLRSLQTP